MRLYSKKINICLGAVTALTVLVSAGCGSSEKKDNDKKTTTAKTTQSAAETSQPAAESVEEADSTVSEEKSSSSAAEDVPYEPGELLSKAAAVFDGEYSYEIELTYSDEPDVVTNRVQASDGKNTYIGIKRSGGELLDTDIFYLTVDNKTVSADNNLMTYTASEPLGDVCLLKTILDNQLERTYNHIPEDSEGMTVEEYTYTGDTFITVYDLYFAEDGSLSKYTALYNIEGEEQLEETAVVKSLSAEYSGNYFDEEFLAEYTDFDTLTEDERLNFCQTVCGKYSISTDDMYTLSITTDDFKSISLDKFTELVYKFAKSDKSDKSSSSDSDKKDKKDKKEEDSSSDSKPDEDNNTE